MDLLRCITRYLNGQFEAFEALEALGALEALKALEAYLENIIMQFCFSSGDFKTFCCC